MRWGRCTLWMFVGRRHSNNSTVLDILNVEYTDHKDIQYGANDPIIANADEIRFDEFEYDVTSVRRTCIQ